MLFAIPNLWQFLCEGWVLPAYRRRDLTFFVSVCLIEGAGRFLSYYPGWYDTAGAPR
jgi:hypothetical protein